MIYKGILVQSVYCHISSRKEKHVSWDLVKVMDEGVLVSVLIFGSQNADVFSRNEKVVTGLCRVEVKQKETGRK